MASEYKTNNIKVLMQKHKLTIENLAQELNLSISTINRLLISAKIDPRLSTLRPIAKFFGVTIDELIGDRPLSLKPEDLESGLDGRSAVVQVPLIHWEQVKEAEQIIPPLNFYTWDNWAPVMGAVGEYSYALTVFQASLPPPFYFQATIIIDPTKEPNDSDYAVVLHQQNPLICQVVFHGLNKNYKLLNLDRTLEQSEIKYCGTIVQWTIPYFGKKAHPNVIYPQHQSNSETTNIVQKKDRELLLSEYLIKAVQINDLARLGQLIAQSKSSNNFDKIRKARYSNEEDTLLHIAVKLGHLEIAKYLIQEGWDVNAQNRRLRAPLHYATYGNVPMQVIDLLLKNGAVLDMYDDDNSTALVWACYLNNTSAIKNLLLYKPDVYLMDSFGLSALDWAANQGNLETLEILLKHVVYSKEQLESAYNKAVDNGQITTANFLEKIIKAKNL